MGVELAEGGKGKDSSGGFAEAAPGKRADKRSEKSADKSPDGRKQTPHFHGHRDRLRKKFREHGADSLADYELLELLLFRSIPRRDVKPLAKTLIAEFGSLSEVLAAPYSRLAEVCGLSDNIVTDLKIVHAAAAAMTAGKVRGRTVLGSWKQVLEYCRIAMAFEEREQFRILFLDKKNQLIRDEVQQVGTVDHTPVYPREVVRRALELSATAIVLVHNHPTNPTEVTFDHA